MNRTMEIDRECSEVANVLLCLGKSNCSESTDEQFDNETVSSNNSEETAHDTLNAIRASSWTSTGTMDGFARAAQKRNHTNIISGNSSDCAEGNETKEVSKAKKVPKQEDGKNKGARGRYKCSLCGAFKTNHVCALVADKLMCSVGTQITHGAAVLCQSTTDTLRCTSSTTDCGGSNDEGCSALGSVPTGELTPLGANSRAASIDLSGLILGPAPVPPSAIPSVDGGVVFQERVLVVSRNRTSIHDTPAPAQLAAAAVDAAQASTAASSSGNPDFNPYSNKSPKYSARSAPRSPSSQRRTSALTSAMAGPSQQLDYSSGFGGYLASFGTLGNLNSMSAMNSMGGVHPHQGGISNLSNLGRGSYSSALSVNITGVQLGLGLYIPQVDHGMYACRPVDNAQYEL